MKMGLLLLALQAAIAHPEEATLRTGHPLLDLAQELKSDESRDSSPTYEMPDLRAAEHALSRAHPPADADCARSLGASVFADLHSELGAARSARGDFPGAAQAFTRALACTPRDVNLLSSLSSTLLAARDLDGARRYIAMALAIDSRSPQLAAEAGHIAYAAGQWSDAAAHYRYAAASDLERTRASYWQIFYWLAQLRTGAAQPEVVDRRLVDGWPRPILLYLQGEKTESDVARAVHDSHSESDFGTGDATERVCEALYYVGQAHLLRGDAALARRYFAAAVNMKILRFIEHTLALAEIARPAQTPR